MCQMFPYCIYGTLTDSFQADVFLLKLRMGDMEKTAAETISWWRCKKSEGQIRSIGFNMDYWAKTEMWACLQENAPH